MSMTGCLTTGSASSTYTLTDETGKTTTVTGTSDLQKHVSHRVRLTGKMSDSAGTPSMTVTKIEHISTTCNP
jgi:hypothetical protein